MLDAPFPGHEVNAGGIDLAQSAFHGFGFMISNPSICEKVAEGPPRLPGTHLSGPDTHPTPGHITYEPGHPLAMGLAPAAKKTATAMTATTIYHDHLGSFIC